MLKAWRHGVRLAEGEVLVFLQDDLRFEGDWLEGIQAALEGVESPSNSGQSSSSKSKPSRRAIHLYLPRIMNVAGVEDAVVTPDAPRTSMTPSQILFEERRGSLYGEITLVEDNFALEQLRCWGCSRKTWTQLADRQATLEGRSRENGKGAKQATPMAAYIVEDTLVF
ncbi:MAG TPA: hypothetical protein VHP35_16325, partial [Terriglobia bacterium]|nr:hypothetical protein [Terriglobia bacterium]